MFRFSSRVLFMMVPAILGCVPAAGAQWASQAPRRPLPPTGTPSVVGGAPGGPASSAPTPPPAPVLTGPGHVLVELLEGPIQIKGPGEEAGSPVVKGALLVLEDTLGTAVGKRIRTNDVGQATFTVRAGSYKIHVLTCPGAYSLPPKIPTTVRPGGGSAVRIGCNIKPRR